MTFRPTPRASQFSFALSLTLALGAAACSSEPPDAGEGATGSSEDALGVKIGVPGVGRPPFEANCRSLDEVESEAAARGVPLGPKLGGDTTWGSGLSAWAVRPFALGAIIRAPGKCAAEIHGSLYDEYLRVGWQKLGYPTADVSKVGAAEISHLAFDAAIIARADTGVHAFRGRIEREWVKRGGVLGLGVPVSTQAPMRSDFGMDGEFTDFERGSLYDINPPEDSPKWLPGPAHPLRTLSVADSLKYQALPSTVWSHYGPPSWDTKYRSGGSISHFDLGGEIWRRPEGEPYLLYGPILAKYNLSGGEKATLGWPRSDQFFEAQYNRDCQLFDGGVICSMRATGVVVIAPTLGSLDHSVAPVDEITNYPNNDDYGWTDQLQGVAHDASYWYFTNREWLFRIPLSQNLRTSKDDWYGVHNPPGYDHFGDLDQKDGILYVPVSGPAGWGIAFYDAVTLAYRGVASVGAMSSDPPWCAINPIDGRLYASTFNAQKLFAFDIGTESVPTLRLSHTVPLLHSDGRPSLLGGLLRVQGGTFSPRGTLYLAVEDYGDWTDMDLRGLLAFDANSGRLLTTHDVEFHPERTCVLSSCFDSGEELEGLDFFDVDGKGLPGIGGQLHLLMIDNDLGNDTLFFKHFRVRSPAPVADL